jgi:ribonuclease PH
MEHLGERTILVDCDVIQADGGTRTASITGGFVALRLAMEKLVQAGTLRALPLREFVCAISVGVVDGEPLLDLCYEEDSRADVDMNLVMTGSNRFIEVQASAERQVFDETQLQSMMRLARKGLESLLIKQQAVLGEVSPVHGK